jgi:hypothetical protein
LSLIGSDHLGQDVIPPVEGFGGQTLIHPPSFLENCLLPFVHCLPKIAYHEHGLSGEIPFGLDLLCMSRAEFPDLPKITILRLVAIASWDEASILQRIPLRHFDQESLR